MSKKMELDLTPQIEVADCIEWMDAMPEKTVDLVFADPPFNLGFSYDTYEDNLPPLEYVRWCGRWIAACHRVLKPTGTLWIASGDGFVSYIDLAASVALDLERLNNKRSYQFYRRAWVVWYYTFGVNNTKNFTKSHTHFLYYTKHRTKFTFNAEDPEVRHASARQLVYNDKRANPKGRLPDDTWALLLGQYEQLVKPFDDVWIDSRVAGTFKERIEGQSCQMPEATLERIIRLCSRPGELVLDPFCGSGTTCAVAQRLGRRSVSCDICPESVARAQKRCGLKAA